MSNETSTAKVVRLVQPGERPPPRQARRSKPVYQFECRDLAGFTGGGSQINELVADAGGVAARNRRAGLQDPTQQLARQNALLRFIESSLRQMQEVNGEDEGDAPPPEVIADRVRALWTAYPNLAMASLHLVEMLGGQWRESEREPPLVVKAIYEAVEETKQMVQNQLIPTQSSIGCYLSQLGYIASRCVYYETQGICADGKRVAWDRFTESINVWVKDCSVQSIEIHNIAERPDRYSLIGAQGRLLAAICSERDLGAALYFR